MIRAVSAAAVADRAPHTEALLRITAAAQVYGDAWQGMRFWCGDGGSVIALWDGTATVHAAEDAEEVEVFLTMCPDVQKVRTDADTAVRLAARWGSAAETGEVMRAPQTLSPTGEAVCVEPAAVYPLLQETFGDTLPPFDVWYADAHYRRRHGRFEAMAAPEGDTVRSCAITTAMGAQAVLLGGVATASAWRGRGLASACVTALTARMQATGRTVWISPKNEPAAAIYRHLGFETAGYWGSVAR